MLIIQTYYRITLLASEKHIKSNFIGWHSIAAFHLIRFGKRFDYLLANLHGTAIVKTIEFYNKYFTTSMRSFAK